MKICIVGYSGSGKSTLARQLSAQLQIPCLHLDSVHWYGDWQERSKDDKAAIVQKFLCDNDSWIIEGNYLSLCPHRFERSDYVIFLNFNRIYCLRMCYKRYRQYRGTPRPDLPCPEKFDFKFAKWILLDGRTRRYKQRLKVALGSCKGRVIEVKSPRHWSDIIKIISDKK